MKQLIIFRADASIEIGTGHVIRCLTLADAFVSRGAECMFICREHEGNLIQMIKSKGYTVYTLLMANKPSVGSYEILGTEDSLPILDHHNWLGSTQTQDAQACIDILATQNPDWLIVDHYALDIRWERYLAPNFRKLMVIDDLANRPHKCDLLLDQTLGRNAADYSTLIPSDSIIMCGSKYALLRPEFVALRPFSLMRRNSPLLRRLLISMGGVDRDNVTSYVLQALLTCQLPSNCRITVAMGPTTPWLLDIQNKAKGMPWMTQVLIGASNMAELMAESDLAIGAAGMTSWERCCLGLPTILLTLAENQRYTALRLEESGAAKLIRFEKDLSFQLKQILDSFTKDKTQLWHMSKRAASLVDGLGIQNIMQKMDICSAGN